MNRVRRILVVCYSRTGTTAEFAGRLAGELDADYERLQEYVPHRRSGIVGFLRSIFDVVYRRPAHLHPTTHQCADYDLIVVGTPVWAARASAPVATWLSQYGAELRAVAFFCTMDRRGDEETFLQMRSLAHRAPLATCAVSRRDLRGDASFAKLSRFVREIHDGLDAQEPQTPASLGATG